MSLNILLLFLMVFTTSVQSNRWEFEFEKDGIKVYTQEVEGSPLKAFKGEMELSASMEEITEVLMDIEHFPKWTYRTSSSTIIKRENNKIFYYNTTLTPAILKNREAYFCSELIKNPATNEVIVTVKTYESNRIVPEGFIRIPYSDGRWVLTPTKNGTTHIVFQVHADPGGRIPAWFANIAALESPKVTLENLAKMVLEKQP